MAKRLCVCRTYVSRYINTEYGCSFSDYINRMRVDYAKTLMQETPNPKFIAIAEQSGFASEQSFYRNFRKFVGMTPEEWSAKEYL